MDPKTTAAESQISPLPPGEGLASEGEVWDPPFERWMRLADTLLAKPAPPPKPRNAHDSKTLTYYLKH